MNGEPQERPRRREAGTEEDLVGRLFTAGLTVLGIGFPIVAATLAYRSDPGISDVLQVRLSKLLGLLLPLIVICSAQAVTCLLTMTGVLRQARWVVIATYVLISYMLISVLLWAWMVLNPYQELV